MIMAFVGTCVVGGLAGVSSDEVFATRIRISSTLARGASA
jgi:hypothetical protein